MNKSIYIVLFIVLSLGMAFGSVTVNINMPGNGQITDSNVIVSAAATSTAGAVTWMSVYLDYRKVYDVGADAGGNLSTTLFVPAGKHVLAVNAWDWTGAVGTASVPFQVGSTVYDAVNVNISSPTDGSTVTSPVAVDASASSTMSTISYMAVYDNNNKVYGSAASSIIPSLSLSPGAHHVVVNAWDNAGTVNVKGIDLTVSSTAPAPAPTPTPTSTYNYYVSPHGNDANPGTSATYPFRTIQHAVNVAKAGTTVHVLDGTYHENVSVNNSGTSSARIIIKSENKWGAKVIGPNNTYAGIFKLNGSYIDITGFDLGGNATSPYGSSVGIWVASSYNRIYGNLIHDLTSYGYNEATGVLVNFYAGQQGRYHDNAIYQNVIHHMFLGNHTIHTVTSSAPAAGSGVYICDGPNNNAYDNIVYSGGKQGFKLNHNATQDRIENNVVGDFQWDGIMVAVGGDSNAMVNDYSVVANNISIDNYRNGVNMWQASPSTLGTHNVFTNNILFHNGTNFGYGNVSVRPVDANAVFLDPMFIFKSYTDSLSGNWNLKTGSPAMNTGTITYAPSFDFNGTARPQGSNVDRGAYEQ